MSIDFRYTSRDVAQRFISCNSKNVLYLLDIWQRVLLIRLVYDEEIKTRVEICY